MVYLQLLLMVIIWSFSFIVVDIGLEIITPMALALHRFVLASISFIIIRIFITLNNRRKPPENQDQNPFKISKFHFLLFVVASFSGISLFFFSQYTSIQVIGPSLPALFVCLLSPVLISILALIFFKEKLNKFKVVGFVIATIGGFLLITGGDITVLFPQSANFIGYFYALLTPFLWAIYSTVTKHLTKTKDTFKVLEFITYLGAIELIFFALLTGNFFIFLKFCFHPIVLVSSFYLGVGCHIIGYHIWNSSQKKSESLKTASFLYIEPFLTLFFSFLFQRNEVIVPLNIIGGIIVLVAVLIINYF
ncbi:MAG: DMT family transporter [Promethearchaeota archaeon]|nr:MAG: DMT family transporter [Candidatus Lokiarchaeota archaeon]